MLPKGTIMVEKLKNIEMNIKHLIYYGLKNISAKMAKKDFLHLNLLTPVILCQ